MGSETFGGVLGAADPGVPDVVACETSLGPLGLGRSEAAPSPELDAALALGGGLAMDSVTIGPDWCSRDLRDGFHPVGGPAGSVGTFG